MLPSFSVSILHPQHSRHRGTAACAGCGLMAHTCGLFARRILKILNTQTLPTHSEKTKASLYTSPPGLLTQPNELSVAMPAMLVLVQLEEPPTHIRMPYA